jgi:hypothetical protein
LKSERRSVSASEYFAVVCFIFAVLALFFSADFGVYALFGTSLIFGGILTVQTVARVARGNKNTVTQPVATQRVAEPLPMLLPEPPSLPKQSMTKDEQILFKRYGRVPKAEGGECAE